MTLARTATRADFVEVALDILEDKGYGGVTIGALCRGVGVSTGSFYHHFQSMDDFVSVLLRQWEDDQREAMRHAAQEASELRRIEIAKDLAGLFRHGAESAIRAWSLSNPEVLMVQRRVDAMRRANLVALIMRAGVDEAGADLLASVGMALLVGLQQLQDTGRHMADALDLYEGMILRSAQLDPNGVEAS